MKNFQSVNYVGTDLSNAGTDSEVEAEVECKSKKDQNPNNDDEPPVINQNNSMQVLKQPDVTRDIISQTVDNASYIDSYPGAAQPTINDEDDKRMQNRDYARVRRVPRNAQN